MSKRESDGESEQEGERQSEQERERGVRTVFSPPKKQIVNSEQKGK